jgi:protein O-GlcNAc transferase
MSLEQALSFHQRGQLTEAERLYRQLLAREPGNAAAHFLFGMVCLQQGRNDEALASLDRAIALDPGNADAFANRAIALCGLGRFPEAIRGFNAALAINPKSPDIHANRAQVQRQLGRTAEALDGYNAALKLDPRHFGALVGRGGVLREMGRFEDALADFEKALALRPAQAEIFYNCGLVLADMKRNQAALARFDRAVALKPDYADAWNNRGCALDALDRPDEAIASFDRAQQLTPDAPAPYRNHGAVSAGQGRFAEAIGFYDKALALQPGSAETWNDRGAALQALRRHDEALASFDRALALAPKLAGAHNNRGVSLWQTGRIDEAAASFDAAIAADPQAVAALNNRGAMLWARKKDYAAAVRDLTTVLSLDPDYPDARGHLLHLKMYACDWTDFAAEKARIDQGVRAGKMAVEPFVYLALSDNPQDLLGCARLYGQKEFPARPPLWNGNVRKPGKIRLGYVSGEFREQATAFLTAGLYEHHDKNRFELIAFDNGGSDGSVLRARLEAAFDRFVDISGLSAEEAAKRVRAEEIDILINLNGYFGKMRMDLFALRPAPIQVSFLGFPASLGVSYIDYILADAEVIAPAEQQFFTEQVVFLPGTYQVNDDRRAPALPDTDRAAQGLPQKAFVFCYFNQSFKLTPETFGLWMRILAQVEGSVLWLLEDNLLLAGNLRRQAAAHGIDASRLIFAPFVEQKAHLARLGLGDLFLDSLPCGAHTTASDALWAGLPLITRRGSSFAGRVAASLLQAAGLPELITQSAEEFEALAVALARDPERLAVIRRKLASVADTPLFDTDAFRRGIEAAYTTMVETWQSGAPKRGFTVESS